MIAAVAADRVIGRGGALPWRLPADLARFRALTLGHHMIIGRRTWESLEEPPDEADRGGCPVIPVTRRPGAVVVRPWRLRSRSRPATRWSSSAGAARCTRALPCADRIELTMVHASFEGDTRFPELDPARWREVAREGHPADQANPLAYSFVTLVPVR